ncbi:MAG TPA: aminopeptidase P family protein [Beijerinckiaceae bacterium]|nr:aminopeptidase P family protein [Beijerinckiaceae bacterium]
MTKSRLQKFTERGGGRHCRSRLSALRTELGARGLDGFIVPRADEHQGEYVPPGDERLAWLTGFTGSAGVAVALADKAALFIDGRYTEQAAAQTDTDAFAPVAIHQVGVGEWLSQHARPSARIGYDPALHTPGEIDRLTKTLTPYAIALEATAPNPLDAVWLDRPSPPLAKVIEHPERLAGEPAEAKLNRIREALSRERLDALVVSDPHALAWAFNIRGGDVGHTPLPLGYGIIPAEGIPALLLDGRKLSNSMRAKLAEFADIREPADLSSAVATAAQGGRRIRLDAATAGVRLRSWVEAAGGIADLGPDPIALMKARKNAAEQAGARAAHLRDGVAVTRFLAWFDREAPKGLLTEIDAAVALEGFRRDTGALKDLSFPTISAANAHAALPHYRVSTKSNARIEAGIYLVDSGAQYQDGTTDITRTLSVGAPTREMRERNTRVLKGMIAVSVAVFPKGISGAQLDSFARVALWEAGLDFDHGTGHGIGSYLSVHEGPQRISKLGTTALEPGMMLSNEPGYYKPGAFGIRIENLVLVEERRIQGAERVMYGFETLTLVPIDRRLIVKSMLTRRERDWLDAYHARVQAALKPHLDRSEARWLTAATAPL